MKIPLKHTVEWLLISWTIQSLLIFFSIFSSLLKCLILRINISSFQFGMCLQRSRQESRYAILRHPLLGWVLGYQQKRRDRHRRWRLCQGQLRTQHVPVRRTDCVPRWQELHGVRQQPRNCGLVMIPIFSRLNCNHVLFRYSNLIEQ